MQHIQKIGLQKMNSKLGETKLSEQFKYFRGEFLDAAFAIGVPLPLDMAEDKTGKLFTFIEQKGPRYIFQIMHSYPDISHLLRCSISLLLITISILKSKMPTQKKANNEKNVHAWLNLLSENVSSWAQNALLSIADGSSVAICINLLKFSHSQGIQELLLNLLAQLVSTSEEAAKQMLLFPLIRRPTENSQRIHESSTVDEESRSTSPTRVVDELNSKSPKKLTKQLHARKSIVHVEDNFTCLSIMFSVLIQHRNRHVVMAAIAEVLLAMMVQIKSPDVCEIIAKTRVSKNCDVLKQSKEKRTSHAWSALIRQENEWAGLTLLLKFLKRFIRYLSSSQPDNDIPGQDISKAAALPNHDLLLQKAHARVLLAVCELVINSPNVARYIIMTPGARTIIMSSHNLHRKSIELKQPIDKCNKAMLTEMKKIQLMESSQKHSSSYDVTHGRKTVVNIDFSKSDSLSLSSKGTTKKKFAEIIRRMISDGTIRSYITSHSIENPDSIVSSSPPLARKTKIGSIENSNSIKKNEFVTLSSPNKANEEIYDQRYKQQVNQDGSTNVQPPIRPSTAPLNRLHPLVNLKSPCADDNIYSQGPTTEVSLRKNLFSSNKCRPELPQRISADDILHKGSSSLYDSGINVQNSLKRSISIQSTVLSNAHKSGYYANGKSNLSIAERAKMVYFTGKQGSNSVHFESNLDREVIEDIKHDIPIKVKSQHPTLAGMLLDGLGGVEEHPSKLKDLTQSYDIHGCDVSDLHILPKIQFGDNHVLPSVDVLFP